MKNLLCHWHGIHFHFNSSMEQICIRLGLYFILPCDVSRELFRFMHIILGFPIVGKYIPVDPSPFRLEKLKPCCSPQSRPLPWIPWHLSLWATFLLCLLDSLSLVRHAFMGGQGYIPWFPPGIGTGQDTQWMFNEPRSLAVTGPFLLCARLLWNKALMSLRSSAVQPKTFKRHIIKILRHPVICLRSTDTPLSTSEFLTSGIQSYPWLYFYFKTMFYSPEFVPFP